MDKFIIKPLFGVNQLKFGKTRDEIIEDFDAPTEEEGRTDYYELEEFSIALSYDRNDKLEFIEFGKVTGGAPVLLDDIDVFLAKADDVLVHLKTKTKESFHKTSSEPPYTYVFDTLEVALDRPTSPEDYEDFAEDKDGYEHGKYFRSIGIGAKGYFSSAEMVD